MATLPERDDRESTSAGRIAYTVEVPDTVGDGDLDVKVTVGTGDDARVGRRLDNRSRTVHNAESC